MYLILVGYISTHRAFTKASEPPILTVATNRIIMAYRFVVHAIAIEVIEAKHIVNINIFLFSNLLIKIEINTSNDTKTSPAIAIITNDVVSTFSKQIDSSTRDAL